MKCPTTMKGCRVEAICPLQLGPIKRSGAHNSPFPCLTSLKKSQDCFMCSYMAGWIEVLTFTAGQTGAW